MDKRHRRLLQTLEPFDVRVETGCHYKIICNKTNRSITASLTPKNVDHWLKCVARDVRRYLPDAT